MANRFLLVATLGTRLTRPRFRLGFERDTIFLTGARETVNKLIKRPEVVYLLIHPDRPVCFQHVGQVAHVHRRHTLVVQPFNEVAAVAKLLPEGITFRFIGDGPLCDWLETEREAGQVEVTGCVDHEEVSAELNNLRLLVMPPEPTEGLPTVILEAMACGTPAYATPVSGVPDVVRADGTGFLMEHREPDRIVADIEAILDREDLTAVSQGVRDLAVSEYSFEAAVDRYQRLLGDLQAQERH